MINDMKLGIKVMRYGHGLKMNIILGAFFMVIGLAMVVFNMRTDPQNIIGVLYIMFVSLLPFQILGSFNVSNMALASPVRKKLQTTIPATITCSCMLVMYIVEDLLIGIMACIYPDKFPYACKMVVMMIASAVFMMIYLPICNKYMVAGAIVFLILFTSFIPYVMLDMDFAFFEKGMSSFVLISAAGLPLMILGGFLQYLVSLLVYKAPMSKYSQNVWLRKEL